MVHQLFAGLTGPVDGAADGEIEEAFATDRKHVIDGKTEGVGAMRGLDQVATLGHRMLIGASRKGFLGRVGRGADGVRDPHERDVATAVTSAYAADAGVWCLRVHDVVATVDALDVWAAWRGSEGAGA